jgi:hypothetical protein
LSAGDCKMGATAWYPYGVLRLPFCARAARAVSKRALLSRIELAAARRRRESFRSEGREK